MREPNYVIGRGKLFFDPFLPGTRTASGNERYLGNSPELSSSQNEDKVDHYSSDYGIKVKDESASIQNDLSLSFSLDDVSSENLALWFRGEAQSNALAAVTDATTAVTVTALGSYVQLGLTAGNPVGARNVSGVTAAIGATPVTAAGNFEVDAVTGRVYILDTASDISVGDTVTFTYDAALGTEDVVIAAGEVIRGRLVFIADNAVGANRDYIWPYVQISPDGDFSLKGDDWQKMTFGGEVLKLNDSTERQYIVKR